MRTIATVLAMLAVALGAAPTLKLPAQLAKINRGRAKALYTDQISPSPSRTFGVASTHAQRLRTQAYREQMRTLQDARTRKEPAGMIAVKATRNDAQERTAGNVKAWGERRRANPSKSGPTMKAPAIALAALFATTGIAMAQEPKALGWERGQSVPESAITKQAHSTRPLKAGWTQPLAGLHHVLVGYTNTQGVRFVVGRYDFTSNDSYGADHRMQVDEWADRVAAKFGGVAGEKLVGNSDPVFDEPKDWLRALKRGNAFYFYHWKDLPEGYAHVVVAAAADYVALQFNFDNAGVAELEAATQEPKALGWERGQSVPESAIIMRSISNRSLKTGWTQPVAGLDRVLVTYTAKQGVCSVRGSYDFTSISFYGTDDLPTWRVREFHRMHVDDWAERVAAKFGGVAGSRVDANDYYFYRWRDLPEGYADVEVSGTGYSVILQFRFDNWDACLAELEAAIQAEL